MRRSGRQLATAIMTASILIGAGLPTLAQIELPRRTDRSVHDFADVITPEHERYMEQIHRALFEKTGVAIVIVTVPRLEGETIGDFALRVGEQWGVGRKGEDRGLVVALAIEERRVTIQTGYGVEGFLPDGKVGRFLDTYAIPYLREGRYSEAMLRTSAALVRAAAEEFQVPIAELEQFPAGAPPREAPAGGRPSLLRIVFLVIVGIGMAILFIRNPTLFFLILLSGMGRGHHRGGFGGGGFGGGSGFGGFGGGGFGGGGASRGF